jgi:DNA-binding Lrp family transcriptional regulator
MPLKPQDIMVALKLCSYHHKRPPISIIAADLKMSPSEVHAAIKRLQQARLLHGPEMEDKPNLSALEEFLVHGAKYAFPAKRGEVTRGMPTSYFGPPLKDEISSGDELPPVWPWRDGETRGIALEPLYKTAPIAALRDPFLYELLALLDAIRDGRARERKVAEKELINRLRTGNSQNTISSCSLMRLAF